MRQTCAICGATDLSEIFDSCPACSHPLANKWTGFPSVPGWYWRAQTDGSLDLVMIDGRGVMFAVSDYDAQTAPESIDAGELFAGPVPMPTVERLGVRAPKPKAEPAPEPLSGRCPSCNATVRPREYRVRSIVWQCERCNKNWEEPRTVTARVYTTSRPSAAKPELRS